MDVFSLSWLSQPLFIEHPDQLLNSKRLFSLFFWKHFDSGFCTFIGVFFFLIVLLLLVLRLQRGQEFWPWTMILIFSLLALGGWTWWFYPREAKTDWVRLTYKNPNAVEILEAQVTGAEFAYHDEITTLKKVRVWFNSDVKVTWQDQKSSGAAGYDIQPRFFRGLLVRGTFPMTCWLVRPKGQPHAPWTLLAIRLAL